jgi:uncharacterized phiE125 gp8 family phage protein
MNQIIDVHITELTTTEPVTLEEARAHLIVEHDDDNDLILAMISAARRKMEEFCSISLIYKRIILLADWTMEWELPYGPVIGIESVETPTGPSGSGPVEYKTADSYWKIDRSVFDPATCMRYRIQYTAGMSVVPADMKRAILAQTVFLYEHRGDENKGPCELAEQLASPFKVMAWV